MLVNTCSAAVTAQVFTVMPSVSEQHI